MENKLTVYELKFDEELVDGVYGISLVEEPAMGVNFIKFNNQKEILFKSDVSEERVLTGPILIPDELIYRNNIKGEPAYVYLNRDTISQLQKNFFKKGYQFNSTIEHMDKIDGVYFFESWIVRNPSNDVANELGFNVPAGTLMMSMKVDNDEVWEDFVKTGKVKGFSIDAMLDLLKVEMSSQEDCDCDECYLTPEQEDIILKYCEDVQFAKDEKIYYKYEGPSPQRRFCRTMLSLDKLYSKKQVTQLNILNSEFAPKGRSEYSVFNYRGGVNCKHVWREYTVTFDKNGNIETATPGDIVSSRPVGRLNLSKNKKNNNIKMNRDVLRQIIDESIKKISLAVELKEFVAEDGISYYAEDLALDMLVTDKDGNVMANANFTFESKIYKTDDQGIIISIEDVKPAEETPAEPVQAAEDTMVDPNVATEPVAEEVDKDAYIKELENKIVELEAEIVKLNEQLVLVTEENISMSSQRPASVGIIDAGNEEIEDKSTGLLGTLRKLSKNKK